MIDSGSAVSMRLWYLIFQHPLGLLLLMGWRVGPKPSPVWRQCDERPRSAAPGPRQALLSFLADDHGGVAGTRRLDLGR